MTVVTAKGFRVSSCNHVVLNLIISATVYDSTVPSCHWDTPHRAKEKKCQNDYISIWKGLLSGHNGLNGPDRMCVHACSKDENNQKTPFPFVYNYRVCH